MENKRYEVLHGECTACMSLILGDNSVDSIVTDPPYELGFMGKKWDGTGVANNPAMWAEALRVLKPGGYLLAFSGSRTYHRMVCAIEDAGFEIRDQIMWLYGSGFPKSHNGEWGGTALKPAHEPIVVARKPLTGTVEANWHAHGTGALNIDGCRVPIDGLRPAREGDRRLENNTYGVGLGGSRAVQDTALGRWPANVIHDGSDEVLAGFPQSAGAQGDVKGTEQSRTGGEGTNCYGEFGRVPSAKRGDTGSAARFFYCAKASRKDRNEGCEGMAQGMPNNAVDRASQRGGAESAAGRGSLSKPRENIHPTVKPTDLMRYLCRLVTPPGGLVLDPFMGSGSTGKAALLEGFRFLGIEMTEEYLPIIHARLQHALTQTSLV